MARRHECPRAHTGCVALWAFVGDVGWKGVKKILGGGFLSATTSPAESAAAWHDIHAFPYYVLRSRFDTAPLRGVVDFRAH